MKSLMFFVFLSFYTLIPPNFLIFLLVIYYFMATKKVFEEKKSSFDRGWKIINFETGKFAVQADSSVLVQFQGNDLLFSVCMDNDPDTDKDFLPLAVDFRESYSAAGRIAGAMYRRREGRPSDNNILYARMTDRALRPMFPKGMINNTVVSITPMSVSHKIGLDAMTIIGSSLAVISAGIPFDGPVWAVQIGYKDDKFIVNPSKEEVETGLFNLLVAGKKGSINMIECGANEVPKDLLKEAFVLAQNEINKICDVQNKFLKQLVIKEQEIAFNKPSEALLAYLSNILTEDKLNAMTGNDKVPFDELFDQYKREALEVCKENIVDKDKPDFTESKVKIGVFYIIKHFIRHRSLKTGKRLDDRNENEIRPLYCEVGLFERTHGTGLFRRGDTQVLTTTTLGWPRDFLLYDDMENDGIKQKYFHHYNFPPFSVWDARPTRGSNRREIGHGKLAEKSLLPVLPSTEDFPYCIRTVSECLGSGGSTSMGSVCGSTLSLLNAGVPLKKPVAGIAMGLISESDDSGNITKYMILNDLQWVEDFTWDMDFKVAGTKDGVTAIQLDTKLRGLTMEIIHGTMDRAFDGYQEIMDFMLQTIDKPSATLSKYAPKIISIKVAPDRVKDVIGKWGETINKIIEECDNMKIDFEDDGTCFLTHVDQSSIDKAIEMIKDLTEDLEVGQIYEGEVSRIEDYGIFVKLPKKKSGMCHVSKLWLPRGTELSKSFKLGDKMKFKLTAIDDRGRLNLEKVTV